MSSIKKIHSQATDAKMLQELSEIKKSLKDTERRVVAEKLTHTQTTNSPYYPDRNYANPLAVKGNAEETEWKEIATYEEQRNIELEFNEEQQNFVNINGKKLNII